ARFTLARSGSGVLTSAGSCSCTKTDVLATAPGLTAVAAGVLSNRMIRQSYYAAAAGVQGVGGWRRRMPRRLAGRPGWAARRGWRAPARAGNRQPARLTGYSIALVRMAGTGEGPARPGGDSSCEQR